MAVRSPISVAMATYNGAPFIEAQLNSILSQTLPPDEIVVCDDGSADATRDILSRIAAAEPRVKLHFNEKNLGFRDNFFKAIALCKNQVIALADQDDVWLPQKLELLAPMLENHDLVCSDLVAIDTQGNEIARSVAQYENRRPDPLFGCLLYRNFVTGCTTLFRKELAENPPPQGERYHDWWLALLASRRNGIGYLDQPTVLYRQHGKNDTGTLGANSPMQSLGSFVRRLFSRKGSKRNQYAAMQFARLEALEKSKLFTPAERAEITEAKRYYKSYLSGLVHPRCWWIGIKRRRQIAGRQSPFRYLAQTISDFWG